MPVWRPARPPPPRWPSRAAVAGLAGLVESAELGAFRFLCLRPVGLCVPLQCRVWPVASAGRAEAYSAGRASPMNIHEKPPTPVRSRVRDVRVVCARPHRDRANNSRLRIPKKGQKQLETQQQHPLPAARRRGGALVQAHVQAHVSLLLGNIARIGLMPLAAPALCVFRTL